MIVGQPSAKASSGNESIISVSAMAAEASKINENGRIMAKQRKKHGGQREEENIIGEKLSGEIVTSGMANSASNQQ